MTPISYPQFLCRYRQDILQESNAALETLHSYPEYLERLFKELGLLSSSFSEPPKLALKKHGPEFFLTSEQEKKVNEVYQRSVHTARLVNQEALKLDEEKRESFVKILGYAGPKILTLSFIKETREHLAEFAPDILEKISTPNASQLCVHRDERVRLAFIKVARADNITDSLIIVENVAKIVNGQKTSEEILDLLNTLSIIPRKSRPFVIFYAAQRESLFTDSWVLIPIIRQTALMYVNSAITIDFDNLIQTYFDFIEASSPDKRSWFFAKGDRLLTYLAKGASSNLLDLLPEIFEPNRFNRVNQIASHVSSTEIDYSDLIQSLESHNDIALYVLKIMETRGAPLTSRYDILIEWLEKIPSEKQKIYGQLAQWILYYYPLAGLHDPRLTKLLDNLLTFEPSHHSLVCDALNAFMTNQDDIVEVIALLSKTPVPIIKAHLASQQNVSVRD